MKNTLFAVILIALSYNASSTASAAKKDDAKSAAEAKGNAEAAAQERAKGVAQVSALLQRRRNTVMINMIGCFRPDVICFERSMEQGGFAPLRAFGDLKIIVRAKLLFDQNEKTPKDYSSSEYIDSDNKKYKVFNPKIQFYEEQNLSDKTPIGYKSYSSCPGHKHFDTIL